MSVTEYTEEMDALLDVSLDELEDLPEFKPFPPGLHHVKVNFETKVVNDAPAVIANFTMIETKELADPNTPESDLSKEGDVSNTMYSLANEFGRGKLKKDFTPVCAALGLSTIRDLISEAKDVECEILTSIRKDKNDPDKLYLNVKEVTVA